MAFIIETKNPFQPFEGLKKHRHPGGISIRGWLQMTYPGFIEFADPTICLLNGKPVMRRDWDREIGSDDIVNFVAVAGWAWVVVIIVIIVAIVLALILSPPIPGTLPASDPVFSIKGQQNEIRLGEPIEVNYGRNRIYPSFAARPFYRYQGNDQFQYSLLCIGQGIYDIHAIQIGDTAITDFEEVQWELLPPGENTTLFHANVQTSIEVASQILYQPGEDNYPLPDGWVGPFPANPSGTEIFRIEVDVTFPRGVYTQNSKGRIENISVTVEFQARLIDDAGSPLGDWFTLFNPTVTAGTTTPIRRTYSSEGEFANYVPVATLYRSRDGGTAYIGPGFDQDLFVTGQHVKITGMGDSSFDDDDAVITLTEVGPGEFTYPNAGPDVLFTPDGGGKVQILPAGPEAELPLGRYEVRARRTSTATIDARTNSETIWEGLRGFVAGDEPDYGDVTMLAVKIRATSNLNANTQRKFNVIATRKLPIYESGGFSDPVVTRSVVWAFVDIFRNDHYGGRLTDENFYDWDALMALDALFESRGDHFDWTFRDPQTVWEAARMVARVGRSLPMLVGSLVTMKRDGPLDLPVTMFTPDNIVKGSFEWSIKLWEPEDFDSVSIEYTEVSTGYKQEQVIATLPDSDATSDHPEEIRFPGIQDRQHAYREGLYMLATRRYLRENITFETGMEGFLPSFGDLVAISHDLPQWGQSGYIVSLDQVGDNFLLYLSEPVVFEDGYDYDILLRNKLGEVEGPVPVTKTGDSKQVLVTLEEPPDFLLGGQNEPMLFLFGKTGNITKYGRVVKIEPQGGERVRITVVNESPVIHSFDEIEAPALSAPSIPPTIPDLPIISALFMTRTRIPSLMLTVNWPAALGAQSYVVQTSVDGENWENRGTPVRPSLTMSISPGFLYVRVAGINNGQGPWKVGTTTFWILEDGNWDDDGIWVDGDFWYDD